MIGLYEREYKGRYEVSKITFGAEPKDYEVFDYLLKYWNKIRFSPAIKIDKVEKKKINPKRMQHIIDNQIKDTSIGTKAQQALKLQQEQGKLERKKHSRQQREKEKQRQFDLKQEKRKKKHSGH